MNGLFHPDSAARSHSPAQIPGRLRLRGRCRSVARAGLLAVLPWIVTPPTAASGFLLQQQPRVVHNGSLPAEDCQLRLERDLVLGVSDQPEEQAFGSIMASAVAEDGSIFIVDGTNKQVSVFDRNGNFVRRFGRSGRGPGEFEHPYRIRVTGTEVYVYDRSLHRINVYDRSGNFLRDGIVPLSATAQPFFVPASRGRLYFSGRATAMGRREGAIIHELDERFRIVRSFGRLPPIKDSVAMEFLSGGDLEVDDQGDLWFAPLAAYEIHRYSPAGELELVITREHSFEFQPRPFLSEGPNPRGGGMGRVGFDNNRAFSFNIDIDEAGRVWHFVRDIPNGRMVIDVFSRDGRFLRSYSLPLEEAPGRIDREGRFYSISSRAGFPQLIRYRGVVTGGSRRGGGQCSDVS